MFSFLKKKPMAKAIRQSGTQKFVYYLIIMFYICLICTAYRWSSAFLFISSAILSNCSTTSLICGSCCSFGLPPRSSEETCRSGSCVFIRSITYLQQRKLLQQGNTTDTFTVYYYQVTSQADADHHTKSRYIFFIILLTKTFLWFLRDM